MYSAIGHAIVLRVQKVHRYIGGRSKINQIDVNNSKTYEKEVQIEEKTNVVKKKNDNLTNSFGKKLRRVYRTLEESG